VGKMIAVMLFAMKEIHDGGDDDKDKQISDFCGKVCFKQSRNLIFFKRF
jgi:hypothetical protein